MLVYQRVILMKSSLPWLIHDILICQRTALEMLIAYVRDISMIPHYISILFLLCSQKKNVFTQILRVYTMISPNNLNYMNLLCFIHMNSQHIPLWILMQISVIMWSLYHIPKLFPKRKCCFWDHHLEADLGF